MDNPDNRGTSRKISLAAAGAIIVITVLCRAGATILTPIWEDALNQNTNQNESHCTNYTSEHHVDPFSMLLIANILFTAVFGLIYICTKIFCSSLITERETGYDKKEFAVMGFTETLAAMFILLSSSGCRTAPYLQALASNFSIPVTFLLRFLILRKRPTCRKLLCAILVLIAEFTALMPEIFPDLENQRAKGEEGGAEGVDGLLWAICNFFGFVPLSIYSIMSEKIMKARARPHGRRWGESDSLNTAYVLFWWGIFSLLSQMLLFWMDIIPGFGMTDNVVDFCKVVWFNIKCFFGYEGCHGFIIYVSVPCLLLVLMNRVMQAYFVRHLEGANLMAMILMIPTPLVFIFFTLFDENPLKWHPHAYLSTWLSIVALCIMIPAIYIYSTGSPEVDYNRDDGDDEEEEAERRPLLADNNIYSGHSNVPYDINYNGRTNVATQAGSLVDSWVQTSPPEPPQPTFQTFRPRQPRQRTNPFVREHRVQSDVSSPRREVQDKYTSGADNGSHRIRMHAQGSLERQSDVVVSSSWPAPEYTSQRKRDQDEEQQLSKNYPGTPERLGTQDILTGSPVHDDGFEDRHGPVWTGSDFNVRQADNHHGYEDRFNPFSTSPFVEFDAENQNQVKYNDPREPAVQDIQEPPESRSPEVGHQLSVSSSPPSYTTLPKD